MNHVVRAAITLSALSCAVIHLGTDGADQICSEDDIVKPLHEDDEGLTVESDAIHAQERDDNAAMTDNVCSLYVAPSTIPNAGVGIFTAKPLQPNELIGSGDMSIPIIDFGWIRQEDIFNPFSSYVWHYQDTGMHKEITEKQVEGVSAFGPGLDSAINMHSALLNAERNPPIYNTGGLHRSIHPGAGAITPYYNGTSYATEYVPAGGELFKSYGDEWFLSRGLDWIPTAQDYYNAEQVSIAFEKLEWNHNKDALWNLVKDWPMWEPRSKNALPSNTKDAYQAAQEGIRSLHQPSATRSLQELQQNGRCMDNIRPGASTIEGAGHGAFATRYLQKGTTITGSGLIWLPYRDLMYMHSPDDEIVGKQIFFNYCLGHGESTLLLCPYGSGVGYINHNASLTNVKIQWAPDGVLNQNNSMFSRKVSEMENDYSVNLAFDYVATRDIKEGEELFMDYGPEWEEAWEAHVREWKAPAGSETYVSASEWNLLQKFKVLLTKLEQEREPYPSNLLLLCHSLIEDEWIDWTQDWEITEKGQECDILYRSQDDAEITYWVQLPGKDAQGNPKRMVHVPRGAFKFFDRPYSTDHHLQNAFRHQMMIPDDMFPDIWKNYEEERDVVV